MKIGIMTFWWSNDNYGQLLQCYALQKYLRDRGHDAFLIRYNYTTDIKKNPLFLRVLKALNPVLLARYLLQKKRMAEVKKEQAENDRHFDDFRTRYIMQSDFEYPTYEALRENPPEADAYIVGSDQVWNYWFENPKRFYSQTHAYFLDFGNAKTKRLSYAASWGVTELSKAYEKEIEPLLNRFDYISVREESGVKLCAECGCSAEWVADPTLLLDAETYRKVYAENAIRRPQKPYILLYMLANECDFDIKRVYDFAEKKNLDVVYVTGNNAFDKRKKYFATIPEWLYLVDNAEYVITNSFHCAVFSTIFHKAFGIARLSGSVAGMNTRFDSLFEQRGCGNRYISDSDFDLLDKKYEVKDVQISEQFLKEVNN